MSDSCVLVKRIGSRWRAAFTRHGELVFWDVHDPGRTIIVSLDHERYKKLILEVADPIDAVVRLRAVRHA